MHRHRTAFTTGMRHALDFLLVVGVIGLLILKLIEFSDRQSATQYAVPDPDFDQRV